MAIYIEINGIQYPASITGRINDKDWNDRASKTITVKMSYHDAISIFVDNVNWSIIEDVEETVEYVDAETNTVMFKTITRQEFYDNSDYSIAGDIIDHRDGHISVKMGRPTAEEILSMLEEVL